VRKLRSKLAAAPSRFAAAAVVALLLFAATYWAFVATELGQSVENLAVRGAELRSEAARAASMERLTQISVVTFGLAIAAAFIVGLLRRRPGLGALVGAIMLVSVLLAELLKEFLPRPVLVPGAPWILRNTFPSGSAAVATAIAVGALLVVPDRLRWLALAIGALYAAVIGDAIQTTGWHRLSDTLGSTLLVVAVACAGLAALAQLDLVQPSPFGRVDRRVRYGLSALALGILVVATVMLVLVVAFPILGSPEGGRRAFLQGAFPLFGAGLTIFALVALARVIEPFSLGQPRADVDVIEYGMSDDEAVPTPQEPPRGVVDRNRP
jgi:hypothetical protein